MTTSARRAERATPINVASSFSNGVGYARGFTSTGWSGAVVDYIAELETGDAAA